MSRHLLQAIPKNRFPEIARMHEARREVEHPNDQDMVGQQDFTDGEEFLDAQTAGEPEGHPSKY
jgi:hypothetical protein